MSKPISFSEFLKEGALKKEKKPKEEATQIEVKPFRIEAEEALGEADVRAFWKRLRHFFRTGKLGEVRLGAFVPALIAPYLQHGNWDTDYPFYFSGEERDSLESLAKFHLEETFATEEAKILRENVVRWLIYAREILLEQHGFIDFSTLRDRCTERLSALEVRGEQGERFRADLQKWTEAMPSSGYVTDFNQEVTLRFLQRKLVHIGLHREIFKEKIRKMRNSVAEMIKAQEKKAPTAKGEKGFDFAENMIALDKVKEILPRSGSKVMDEAQRMRLNSIIERLDGALLGKENEAHLIIQPSLKGDFAWQEIFNTCKLTYLKIDKAIEKAEQVFDKNIGSFTDVLIALRQAELELEGKYNPDVHDDFFQHFKWFKLEEDELELFPPVIVIANTEHILKDGLSQLSNLLVKDKPVNIMALTSRTTRAVDPNVDWEDASHSYRQELAAFGLSHRGAHTLQCASDRPTTLMDGIYSAVRSVSPSLMHLLLPEPEDDSRIAFLKINAAAAGRHFPYVAYDCNKGTEWGSRFDIEHNSQPSKDWPSYPYQYLGSDENEVEDELTFTYADYKAMTREKVEEMFFVPEAYVTDDLIPINAYLLLSQNETTGKVPYIWMIDEDNRMVRAAVPYMWVISCLERLDYWNFIQDVGGVNSYHVKSALQQAQRSWEKAKEEELAALKFLHAEELKRTKNEAASEAMERLAGVLLNMDDLPAAGVQTKKTKTTGDRKPEEIVPEMDEQPSAEAAAEEEEVSAEPYIDSFKCTSCNDCIENFPAIFVYNEDKQALVKDASKGSYEDMVVAAEGCPASCIHPGLPLNKNEKDAEALIKRAEKFN